VHKKSRYRGIAAFMFYRLGIYKGGDIDP